MKKRLNTRQFANQNILLNNKYKSSMTNKRKYDDNYIEFGSTFINGHGVEKKYCVVCYHV